MSGGSLCRLLIACATVVAVGAAAVPAQAAAPAPAVPKLAWASGKSKPPHILRPVRPGAGGAAPARPGALAAQQTLGLGQLQYHGGAVQTQPTIFLDFWGSAWSTATDAGGYTGTQAEVYIEQFLNGMTGSRWFNSQTQYCEAATTLANSMSCPGGAPHVGTSSPTVLTWNDPSAVNASDAGVALEADAAASHFGLFQQVNATVLVLTPTGQSYFSSGGSSFCAYHNFTNTAIYAYIPWLPDAGASCALNGVNGTNDTFGHGHFDGFSIGVGHEVVEAATDPGLNAWFDTSGFETGDKCVGLTTWPLRNIAFNNNFFATQPLWTDAGATCAMEGLGGLTRTHATVTAQDASHRDVFVRGGDGAVWHTSWAGTGWSGWETLGGGTASAPGAVSWGANRIDLFVRGTDNAIWHRFWAGTTWSGWESLGGVLTSGPAVTSWAAGRLDIFAKGGDNALWHKWYNGTGWSGWEPLGGGLASDPSAVSWSSGRLDIFARGGDGAIWHKWYDGTWNGWEPRGGGFLGGAATASMATGLLQVFAIGLDGAIWRQTFNGSVWSPWSSLEGGWPTDPATISTPSAGTLFGGSLELYMAGFDGTANRLVLGV
jgi:hypothetical protein